jgi:transposase
MKKLYCGIDLHATSMQLCVIDGKLNRLLERSIPNDLPAVLSLLRPFRKRLSILVESTFNWYWLVDGLQDTGYEVHLAHTLGLFRITRAKVKTDRRDAYRLAKILHDGEAPLAYIYPKETRPIRDLVRQRTRLVAARAHAYSSLRLRLYQHGFVRHSRDAAKAWDAQDMDALLKEPAARFLAGQDLERIAFLSEQVAAIEKRIQKAASGQEGYTRLMKIPGLGKALSAIVLYETGDVSRFSSARHYSSYCRLVPGTADSGGHSKPGRGAKQGNPHLKAAFTQAAQCAVRHYPGLRNFYERQAGRHPGRGSRLIATDILGHRLAQAAYHILKEGTDYDDKKLFAS